MRTVKTDCFYFGKMQGNLFYLITNFILQFAKPKSNDKMQFHLKKTMPVL